MKIYDTLFFDVDGTLTLSKSPLDKEMANLLAQATQFMNVVVITGGRFEQINKQVIQQLPHTSNLNRLFVLPTSGSQMFRYTKNNVWEKVYERILSPEQKERIFASLNRALAHISYSIDPKDIKGIQIEDRDSQITLSMLGQEQSPERKENWDTHHIKRRELIELLGDIVNEFDVKIGGSTSIDITLKGIDKAFGIREFYKHTELDIKKGLFIGDQIIPGGNDFAATYTDINIQKTTGISETKKIIQKQLESFKKNMVH